MGYDLDLCKLCLQVFNSDLNKAIHFFLENKGILEDKHNLKTKLESLIKDKSSSNENNSIEHQNKIEKAYKANRLLNKIAKDMPEDDEAYLDFNMEEDAFYINKYYSLLD